MKPEGLPANALLRVSNVLAIVCHQTRRPRQGVLQPKKELLARLVDIARQLQAKKATHQNINAWLYRGLAALEGDGDAAMSMLAEANAMEAAAALV